MRSPWRRADVAVVGLTLLAFAARALTAARQALSPAEAALALRVAAEPAVAWPAFDAAALDGPLVRLLNRAVLGGGASPEIVWRLPAIVAGTVLVPLLVVFGRRLGRPNAGLVAGGLATVAPTLVWIGQDARWGAVWAATLSVLAAALLATGARRPRRLWPAYALCLAAAGGCHPLAWLWLPAQAALVARRRDRAYWLLAATAAAGFSLAAWPIDAWRTAAGRESLDLALYLTDLGVMLTTGPAFDTALPGGGRWLWAGVVAIGAVGARSLGRRGRALAGALLLAGWVGWLLRQWLPVEIAAFSVVAPLGWLLVGAGMTAAWARGGHARRLTALAAFVLVGAQLLSLGRMARAEPPTALTRPPGMREAVALVRANATDADRLLTPVAAGGSADPRLLFYLSGSNLAPQAVPSADATLVALAEAERRVWYIAPGADDLAVRAGAAWPGDRFLVERYAHYRDAFAAAYRPLAQIDAVVTPQMATSTAGATLEGSYVLIDGQPRTAARGGSELRVSLVWAAEGPVSADYTVFVHVLDASGRLIAQHDGAPAGGRRPTSTWASGERLIDAHPLTLPNDVSSGTATIVVGLYDPATLARLTFGESDAVPVATLTLAPRSR